LSSSAPRRGAVWASAIRSMVETRIPPVRARTGLEAVLEAVLRRDLETPRRRLDSG